jgi:hypothetical protein
MKKFLCCVSIFIFLTGMFLAGSAKAADFTAWTNVWFRTNSVQTGFSAPLLPTGGKVTSERSPRTMFLKFVSCDATLSACNVSACTQNQTTSEWTLQTGLGAIIAGGNALDFIGSLGFSFDKNTGVTETYTVPFRVKGGVQPKNPNVIRTATFVSTGGVYTELREDQTTGGTGDVTLNGAIIQAGRVGSVVPTACQP